MAKKISALILCSLFLIFFVSTTRADELLDVQNQIDKNKQELSSTQANLDKIKRDLASLSTSLSGTAAQLEATSGQLNDITKQLDGVDSQLVDKKTILASLITIRNDQIRQVYQYPQRSPLEMFLSTKDLGGFTENLVYQSQVLGDAHSLIKMVNSEALDLVKISSDLQTTKDQLASLKSQLADKLASLNQSLKSAASQKSSLNNKLIKVQSTLSGLSDKQNQLIAAKIGTSLATGGLTLADDPNASISYSPSFSPAYAAFSFGAYSHRNGMSQYGALGRAQSGQNAETILAVYYPGTTLNKGYPVPSTMTVNGTNDYGQNFNNVTYGFDEYLKHLYEVPASWPMEVLKAQAVAARSYAVRYGSPICPSQSCQEVKLEINSSAWQQAVDATSGWVLTGGSGSFQYSSTSGGYLNTSGWDTTNHNMSNWPSGAYENIAGSPWFYKGWYRAGTSNSGATCGRVSPWLTQAEFIDILNSWVVYTKGDSNDKNHVVTTDTACWGGAPYSVGQMKTRADALSGSYNQIYGLSVQYSPSGFTSSVNFVTDRGVLTIDGATFKDIFNLRAPGYLVIKTVLYNLEKK